MADRGDPRLPKGWEVAATFTYKGGMEQNSNPTDDELIAADAVIVKFTDAMGIDYRTIHGPVPDYEHIADAITYIIEEESPVR